MSGGRSARPGRLAVLMLSALVPFSAQAAKASPPDTLVVSTSWLADRLDDPNVVIIHTGMSRSILQVTFEVACASNTSASSEVTAAL